MTTTDHFAELGLARAHALDRELLEQRYLELAARHHPDKVANEAASERRRATARSGAINQAYRVLRDPVARAEHLCALAGWDVEHSGEWGPDMAVDQAFLIEMIERREQLQDLSHSTNDREALQFRRRATTEAEARCDDLLDEAIDALEDGDDRAAAMAMVKRRYFDRLLAELDDSHENSR